MNKGKLRVLLAAAPDRLRHDLMAELKNWDEIQLLMPASNGVETLDRLLNSEIDLLLIDPVLSGLDGIGVLRKFRALRPNSQLKVILVTSITSPYILSECSELGVFYFFYRPFVAKDMVNRLRQICSDAAYAVAIIDNKVYRLSEVRKLIIETLGVIGMPPHLRGYDYTKCSARYLLEDRELQYNLVTKLYPKVGEICNVNGKCVERSIRSAIEATWNKADVDTLNALFGYTVSSAGGRPTNAEFLARLCELIRLRCA